MGESEREREPASPGTLGPAWVCGGGQSPGAPSPRRPRDPHPVGSSWPPALSGPPPDAHPRQDTVSTSRPTLGHTQRHTKTHTGLWPVTLALGCVHTASQMHILTPSGRAHTHSIPDTHTFMVTHSFQGGGNAGHTGRHSLPWVFTVTLRAPSRHAGRLAGAQTAPLADLQLHRAVCRLPAVLLQKAQGPGSWGHLLKA